MPRFTDGRDVVTIPDVLVAKYEAKGWTRYQDAPPARPLSEYTKKELQALGQSRGVDLTGAKTKADLIARLTAPPKE